VKTSRGFLGDGCSGGGAGSSFRLQTACWTGTASSTPAGGARANTTGATTTISNWLEKKKK